MMMVPSEENITTSNSNNLNGGGSKSSKKRWILMGFFLVAVVFMFNIIYSELFQSLQSSSSSSSLRRSTTGSGSGTAQGMIMALNQSQSLHDLAFKMEQQEKQSTLPSTTATTRATTRTAQAAPAVSNSAPQAVVLVDDETNKNTTTATVRRKDVSLVTSFFADGILTLTNASTTKTPEAQHLHEIAAAILKNIHNQYFAQVVVILDGANPKANCDHFRQLMERMGTDLLEWKKKKQQQQEAANINILPDTHQKALQKLTCINREEGQPNYYEMFRYATNTNLEGIVTSPVVILENADQVFDETLYWAGMIKPNALLTLPTHGYNKNLTPPEVHSYFEFANRNYLPSIDWDDLKENTAPRRCTTRSASWDGYVFHREYLEGTLEESSVWKRQTNQKNSRTEFFNMNESGAENAALWSVLKGLNSTRTKALPVISTHGCFYIQTWHFHAAPQMHTVGQKSRKFTWPKPKYWRVPEPKSRPLEFPSYHSDRAFVVNPKTTTTTIPTTPKLES